MGTNIMYHLGTRSWNRLVGVHPDLIDVVELAISITEVDFTVLEGMRTLSRQRVLYKRGATTTLNSRHLTGHAVDLGALVNGEISWEWPHYHKINDAMEQASLELDIDVDWGGDWKSFPDGPHYQLLWAQYPKEA